MQSPDRPNAVEAARDRAKEASLLWHAAEEEAKKQPTAEATKRAWTEAMRLKAVYEVLECEAIDLEARQRRQ